MSTLVQLNIQKCHDQLLFSALCDTIIVPKNMVLLFISTKYEDSSAFIVPCSKMLSYQLKKRDAFLNVRFFVSTKIKTAGSYSKIAELDNLQVEKQITKHFEFDFKYYAANETKCAVGIA